MNRLWFLAFPVVIFGPIAIRYVLQEVWSPALVGFGNYYEPISWAYYVKDNLYYAIIFILFGISYYFIQYSQEQQKLQFNLTQTNRQLHLDQLRSQMNAHFLLNTLNGLYALFQMKDDRAGPYLQKLSNLFEYSLYEPDNRVPLKTELDRLRNFIDLQALRIPGESYFEIRDETSGAYKIPQFLIFPLVENAFKHGDLKNPMYKATLEIEDQKDKLRISCRNLKAIKRKDPVGGIGINNLTKRIELLYQEAGQCEFIEDDMHYEVRIELPLER